MVNGRSAALATWYGLPLSSDSSCASSSACFSIKSARRFISTPRCAGVICLRHGPLSNAVRAALTALSTSAASDSCTCAMTSPVDGLTVGNVLPEALFTHLPLISSCFALIFTVGSNTAVAMNSSYANHPACRETSAETTLLAPDAVMESVYIAAVERRSKPACARTRKAGRNPSSPGDPQTCRQPASLYPCDARGKKGLAPVAELKASSLRRAHSWQRCCSKAVGAA